MTANTFQTVSIYYKCDKNAEIYFVQGCGSSIKHRCVAPFSVSSNLQQFMLCGLLFCYKYTRDFPGLIHDQKSPLQKQRAL